MQRISRQAGGGVGSHLQVRAVQVNDAVQLRRWPLQSGQLSKAAAQILHCCCFAAHPYFASPRHTLCSCGAKPPLQ